MGYPPLNSNIVKSRSSITSNSCRCQIVLKISTVLLMCSVQLFGNWIVIHGRSRFEFRIIFGGIFYIAFEPNCITSNFCGVVHRENASGAIYVINIVVTNKFAKNNPKPSQNITVASHERKSISTHQPFDCLFNSQCGPTTKKHLSPHYWPFERGIHRSLVNSPHKGPVTRKILPFDDVIMKGKINIV